MGDHARALTPARCALNVRSSFSGVSFSSESTLYIVMVASADPTASRDWSGLNLTDVMPLACARGRVCRHLKDSVLPGGFTSDSGLGVRALREESERVLDLERECE